MKFRALNTFTFLFILSFLFANVSGGMLDGVAKLPENFEKFIRPTYLNDFPNKEVLEDLEKIKEGVEKAKDLVEKPEMKDYLENLGFSNSSTSPSNSEVESSIIKFQNFFKLKTTGKLDKNTIDALTKPRCGVPDIVNTKSFKPWWKGKELKYYYLDENVQNETKSLIQDAFNRWSNVTGLNFTETMKFNESDILIGFLSSEKGVIVGGAYISNTYPCGIMLFDIEEQWVSLSKSVVIKEGEVDFESVVMHQIGHLLGLEHSSVEEAVMYPIVLPKQKIELVNGDDLQKIQQIYGVQNVKNDAADSSWPVVFWRLSFLGFVVCFLGLL